MKKFLTILFCVFFNVIAFSQKNPKRIDTRNITDPEAFKRAMEYNVAQAKKTDEFLRNIDNIKYYGPTDNRLMPNKNWSNSTSNSQQYTTEIDEDSALIYSQDSINISNEDSYNQTEYYGDVAYGREKSWWNPFDKGRERWSGMSYDHTLEAAKDIAEEAREYDRVVFVKGIIFWLIVFGIIGFVIYSIRKNKKDRTTSHSQKELNGKLDNLKSAYDKGLFSNDEYQQKVNTLNKEFQQKEEIENKEKIMKEKIETLNQLYKEGIISRQELDAKIFKMEQDNL